MEKMIRNCILLKKNYSVLGLLSRKIRANLLRVATPKTYRLLTNTDEYEVTQGFSVQPYLDNKCIFIHIPKCGGISLNKTLFGTQGVSHVNIRAYEMILSKKDFDSYFKFTIVRNPWDKLLSAYNFLKSGGLCEEDRYFFDTELSSFPDFNSFVMNWINKKNIYKIAHFYPQSYFICDYRRKNVMNYIGHLEDMENSYKYISRKLDINRDLLHENKTVLKAKCGYRDIYSNESMHIVGEVYGHDIRLLGYEF